MRLSLGDRRTPCLNLTLDHKTAGIRLDNAPLTHFCWRPSLGVTWYGSETFSCASTMTIPSNLIRLTPA